MVSKDNWRYISRVMRMKGWSLMAIEKTLRNLGHTIPLSTLSDTVTLTVHANREVPDGYREWLAFSYPDEVARKNHTLSLLEVISLVNPDESTLSPAHSEIDPENALLVEGFIPKTDGFSVYSPSKRNRNGVKAYLERERRENRKMSSIDDILH
jgi:hypothetical protein